ncbi:MAG: PQQ-binding-like beta-propeller repeat protein [Deltaproteobacteria bacterium]|nr:PQQ-binding-like beta-propeller repeat protein [Deltaproteobacteria bacterium]
MRARPAALLVAALAGVFGSPRAARAQAPDPVAAGDWPQDRRDAHNTGMADLVAPQSGPARPWTFDGSGRIWGYEPGITTWTSPALAVVEGRAVVAVGSYDHNVYCLDAATGERRWKFTTGGSVLGTPAIWHDGGRAWLFATSSDRLVYGLEAGSGRQLWVHSAQEFRPTLGGARLSSPAVGETAGRPAVFVGTWVWDSSLASNLQRGALVALGARDGKPLWRRDLGDNQLTAPVHVRAGGRGWVLVGSSNGSLYAVDADDGTVQWQRAELDAIRSQPAVWEGRGSGAASDGPFVVMASKYGTVRALRLRDGQERWSYKTGDRVTGSPAVAEVGGRSLVVVGSYDRVLYALDAASGTVVWRYTARGGVYSSPGIALVAGRPMVLAAAWDNTLHAVSLRDGGLLFQTFTGRPLWTVAGLDESNWSSPAAARVNGAWMAFVGSYDGTLRGLPLDESGRTPAPLRSNLWFWLSFPIALVPFGALAVLLTRLERGRQRRRRQTSQATTTRTGTAA